MGSSYYIDRYEETRRKILQFEIDSVAWHLKIRAIRSKMGMQGKADAVYDEVFPNCTSSPEGGSSEEIKYRESAFSSEQLHLEKGENHKNRRARCFSGVKGKRRLLELKAEMKSKGIGNPGKSKFQIYLEKYKKKYSNGLTTTKNYKSEYQLLSKTK